MHLIRPRLLSQYTNTPQRGKRQDLCTLLGTRVLASCTSDDATLKEKPQTDVFPQWHTYKTKPLLTGIACMSHKEADRSVTDDGHHRTAFSPKAESYLLSTSVMTNRKQQG